MYPDELRDSPARALRQPYEANTIKTPTDLAGQTSNTTTAIPTVAKYSTASNGMMNKNREL